jgi:hypothetical protein
MADESEVIGRVQVKVEGNFSQMDADFQAAVAKGVAGGQTLAEAIQSGMASVPGMAERASASIGGIGTAAAASAAQVKMLSAELDATGQNVAYAGENFGKFGEQAGGSIRSLVSEVRVFRQAFMAVMLPEMIGHLVSGIVEFFEKENNALHEAMTTWREFNASLQITDAELQVSNDKLSNQIAKLEGVPQNNLKLALDEAALSADKLALSLDKDSDEMIKLLEKSNADWFQKMFGTASLAPLEEALKRIQDTMSGDKTGTGQAMMLQREYQAVSAELDRLQEKTRVISVSPGGRTIIETTVGTPAEIAAAEAALAHIREQAQRISDEQTHESLTSKLGKLQQDNQGTADAFAEQNEKFREQAEAINEAAEAIEKEASWLSKVNEMATETPKLFEEIEAKGGIVAETLRRIAEQAAQVPAQLNTTTAESLIAKLVNGQKELDEQSQQLAKTFDKAWDEWEKGAQKGVVSGDAITVTLQERLSPAMYAAYADATHLREAFSNLHIKDADEELAKMVASLQIVARQDGVTSTAFVQGWQNYSKALAAAAQETGDFQQRLAGGVMTEIPSMFQSIEGALANDLVHWKNWSQSVINIFQSFAQMALQTVMHALFQPLQQMLTGALGGILSGLSSGGGMYAGIASGAIGFFAEGTDYVPRTQLAVLHEGERVVTKERNFQDRLEQGIKHRDVYHHMHRALEGIENVPRMMPVMLDPGERVLTKESNDVFSKMLNTSMGTVPSVGPQSTYQNSSNVDHIDMRGATIMGMTKEELASTIFDTAVKRGRRANVRW